MSAAVVCDKSTLTADGNVRIVWIKYRYLNCINISDVWCFFPETHPRNLEFRQHAENTNNTTTPPSSTSSSGSLHERVADPRCTAVASCSIRGCDPSSVITVSLSFAVVCMYVCVVPRILRSPRKIRIPILVIWSNGHAARFWISWREFEPRRVHVYFFFFRVHAEFMSICLLNFFFQLFFPTFFLCYVRNLDITDNRQHTSSAGCVLQPAGYNAIHACRLPAEQEATPHACGSLSALYYCSFLVAFVIGPSICRPAGLCCRCVVVI